MFSLILGGGTRGGFLSDAILQLLAIPLLLVSLWRIFEVPLTKQTRVALFFCLAIAVVPLVQLVPLPPWLWTALPNRQPSLAAFEVLGHSIPWMPISVSPHQTWLSALSLLPPLGIFLGALLLGYRERRLLSLVVLAVGVLSVFIGLIQFAQGPESALRFFQITNPTEAVGFFANRNHFAALLYCLTLFAAAWIAHAAIGRDQQQYDTASIVASIGGFTVLVLFLAGEAMARSRAGLGLTIVALFGAFAVAFSDRRTIRGSGLTPAKLLFGASVLALTFVVQFGLYRIMERFADDPLQDARVSYTRNTVEAARAYMPLGSGLGTFVPVYAMFEKPEDTVINAYANHAHDDALELWLETGIAGPALMGLFIIWLVLRSVQIWRSPPDSGVSELDRSLARAATIVAALVLVHSLVDYPLRTGAMMAVMAFACALLIEPPVGTESGEFELQARRSGTQHRRKQHREPSPTPSSSLPRPGSSAAPSKVEAGELWGANVNWPAEWRKTAKPISPGSHEKRPTSSKPPRK